VYRGTRRCWVYRGLIIRAHDIGEGNIGG